MPESVRRRPSFADASVEGQRLLSTPLGCSRASTASAADKATAQSDEHVPHSPGRAHGFDSPSPNRMMQARRV